ncbi:MAG: DUF424 domain-containing protein [Thermoproteota archaeon]
MGKKTNSVEFYIKIYCVKDQVLVAACDAELLGKTIRTKKGVDVYVSERFYGGTPMTVEKAREAMKSATSLNLMGNRIVKLALSSEIGHPDSVMMIGDVAHLIIIQV